jgi:hypothetical protein
MRSRADILTIGKSWECPIWSQLLYSLDFAFVNILTIADSEDKDIKTQQGIDYPVVTDAVLAKPGKLTLEHRIGFRLLDEFILNEAKDSFRLGLR